MAMLKTYHVVVLGALALVLTARPYVDAGAHPPPCPKSIAACPVIGCSSDPNNPHTPVDKELNTKKNRGLRQIPSQHVGPYDVSRFRDPTVLPTHVPKTNPKDVRSGWGTGDTAAHNVRAAENHEVALVGYILRAKAGDAESCNCGIATSDVVDTHINLVEDVNADSDPSALLGESVIAEITHRIRNPAWTLHALNAIALANQDDQPKPRVRITGALTYDNLHWDMLKNGTRGTLWEVHPIRKIEVEVNGRFEPFTGKNGPTTTAHRRMATLLTAPGTPAAQQRAGASVRFTNARRVRWSSQQVQALDARMVPDSS